MGRFFKILFLLAFLVGIGFVAHKTVFHVNDKQFAILIDVKDKAIKRYYNSGWHFIYLTLFPGKVKLNKYLKSGNGEINLTTALGPLEYLKSNNYNLKVTLEFRYQVNVDDLKMLNPLLKEDFINSEVCDVILKVFPAIVKQYEKSDIFPENISTNWEKIQGNLLSKTKSILDSRGIIISSISKIGLLQIPERVLYLKGLQFYNELMELQKRHQIALQKVQYILSEREERNKAYYIHLQKISELIKNNPDLIKYIYIDKMTSNVKIGPLIKNSEFRIDFDDVKSPQSPQNHKREDIDNFR